MPKSHIGYSLCVIFLLASIVALILTGLLLCFVPALAVRIVYFVFSILLVLSIVGVVLF